MTDPQPPPADLPPPAAQQLAEVLERTGISRPALARKLGIPVAGLQAVAEGGALSGPAAASLLSFWRKLDCTQAPDPSPRGPRPPEGVQLGDCHQLLAALPEGSVDAVLSDIPYGIGLDGWDVLHDNKNSALLGQSAAQRRADKGFERRRKPIQGWSADDREIPRQYYDWCQGWGRACLRVLKPGGSALIFAGRRLAPRCAVALEDVGFVLRDQLAWEKPQARLRAQRLSVTLRRRAELAAATRWDGWRLGNLAPVFEPILHLFKPYAHTLVDNVLEHGVGAQDMEAFADLAQGKRNLIRAGLAPGEGGLHPAQKPLALLRPLVALVTPPGGLVLDPFAGAGSTGVAALQLGRRALLMERDPAYAATAAQRLETATPTNA